MIFVTLSCGIFCYWLIVTFLILSQQYYTFAKVIFKNLVPKDVTSFNLTKIENLNFLHTNLPASISTKSMPVSIITPGKKNQIYKHLSCYNCKKATIIIYNRFDLKTVSCRYTACINESSTPKQAS